MNIKEYYKRYNGNIAQICKNIKDKEEVLFFLQQDKNNKVSEFLYLNLFNKEKGKCKECNKPFIDYLLHSGNWTYYYPRCPYCYPNTRSKGESEIRNFIDWDLWIKDIKISYRREIKPYELDIYIPEKRLAIEFDGLMYHSFGKHTGESLDNSNTEIIKKNYHLQKTELCESRGIHLLHIFENEWVNPIKKDIWKSIISWKLQRNTRLFARNLILDTEVPPSESKLFLEENHLQGYVPASIRIGLRDKENNLISLMTFGKSRYWKEYTYELLRFVTKKYTNVVGGASKIFKYFKSIMKDGEILITYADRRYSQGNVYEKLGMTSVEETKPNYFYFKLGSFELFSRVFFQKYKLEEKLEQFNPGLTETENMYNNRFRKIYDCGNKKYIYKKI